MKPAQVTRSYLGAEALHSPLCFPLHRASVDFSPVQTDPDGAFSCPMTRITGATLP